ncbi:MAG: hypothetical protein IKN98_04955 [Bacteroidales bacterium]|nr:hypothetical protein [Bacteroidales bacterium]
MKKTSLFFKLCICSATLVVGAILLVSCHKKNCQGLVYENPPVLSDTGYNTCKAIYYNFYMYEGIGEGHEVVYQVEGSRLKVYGYIYTYRNPEGNYYALADSPQQSDEHPDIELKIDGKGFFDTIEVDRTKKYYVTGTMGFNYHPYHGDDFGACMTFSPTISSIHEYNME